ncbi:MAG: ion transporter, partial [Bacteroidales bacterium]
MTLWQHIRTHLEPEYRDKTLRESLYIMIFQSDTRLGKGFDVALIFIILASIINVMLQSMLSYNSAHYRILRGFEYGFTAFFTVEYILRVYCATKPKKYIFSFFGLVDLFAILPVYLNLFLPGSNYLVAIRAFRLIRVFRIFKLFRFLKQGDMLLYSL